MTDVKELLAGVVSVVVITVCLRHVMRRIKDGKRRSPPNVSVLTLFRLLLKEGTDVLPSYFLELSYKLGPLISFSFGRKQAFVLNGRKAIHEALVTHAEAFADRPDFWTELNVLNPRLKGLVFSHYDGATKKNLKLTQNIFKEFGLGALSVSETRILMSVESTVEQIKKLNGRPFNPRELLTYATSNTVFSILFGRKFVTRGEGHRAIIEHSMKLIPNFDPAFDMAPWVRFLPGYRRKIRNMMTCRDGLMGGIRKGIEESKFEDSEITFVRRFVEEEGPTHDEEDLAYVLRDLCMASLETVSSTLVWALLTLANRPEIQSRLQKEIDEVVPAGRLPSLDDRPRINYMEAVILEVMRRYTIIPFAVPHSTLKDTEACGYFIPKGALVLPNLYSAHMDREFWTDPENFRPERFLDSENNIIQNKMVVAFSLGKRSCPGEILGRQQAFLFLASLLQHFDIRPPEGQESIAVREITTMVMHPTPFEIRFVPRNAADL